MKDDMGKLNIQADKMDYPVSVPLHHPQTALQLKKKKKKAIVYLCE